MKKLMTLLMILLLLCGCSAKKNKDTEPAFPTVKPTQKDPIETFYGTWRTSAVYANGARFDMEQLEALGSSDALDMILIINKDGTVTAYSAYYDQIEEETWTKGENGDSIAFADMEFFIEEDEMVMTMDDEKLYMAKISERQDGKYLDELIETETEKEETQVIEEPEPEEETIPETSIRPEVKEAIDAYEAFIDEYCDFMVKYSESNGTDLSILSDYMTFMTKLENYSDKMDDLEDDLTDAESIYYFEVLNRCNEKILKIAY